MTRDQYTENWLKARADAQLKGLKIVEHGWEQHVIIDEPNGIVYRYPRHDAAAAKLADEVSVLQEVNRQKWPIALPVIRDHNQVFTAYNYIPGDVLTVEKVAQTPRSALVKIGHDLGTFLASFHKLHPSIIEHKVTKHATSLLEYYDGRINSSTNTDFYTKARQALDELVDMMKNASQPVVIHGELHGTNIVINPHSNELKGVIDLSDMETGDPHQELRKVFMTFPDALQSIIESYAQNGGQSLDKEKIIQWAYVNEWANASFFAEKPDSPTYQRAVRHLKQWKQL